MEVFLTKDADLFKKIFSDQSVYPFVRDDSCPEDVSRYDIKAAAEKFIMLEVRKYHNGPCVGMFCFDPISETVVEAHTMLTDKCRGSDAIKASKLASGWIFSNTQYTRIESYSFSDSPATEWFCRKSGLTKTSEKTWPNTRNGHLVTMSRFAMEKTN